jgi:trehalose 6-phosphate synthase/phosphatase
MAQTFKDEGAEFAESPRPLLADRQESVHPGLRPSLVNVPVTPGIHLGEYASRPTTGDSVSYFSHNIAQLRNQMAQSPSDAAAGAKTNDEILRRMSVPSPGLQRKDSVLDIDPRAANPSLGLSGGVISATFCIPHSLQYRKGQDWVSYAPHISRPLSDEM